MFKSLGISGKTDCIVQYHIYNIYIYIYIYIYIAIHSLPTYNTLARVTTPILDQSAKLAIIFVHPKDMWLTGPDSGSLMSKWFRPYLVVLTRGITADLSFRREYCDRFSAKRFSIKVGAMLLTISNTSRAIVFTLFICRYPVPTVLAAILLECMYHWLLVPNTGKIHDKRICPTVGSFVFFSRCLYFFSVALVPSLSALFVPM